MRLQLRVVDCWHHRHMAASTNYNCATSAASSARLLRLLLPLSLGLLYLVKLFDFVLLGYCMSLIAARGYSTARQQLHVFLIYATLVIVRLVSATTAV